MYSFLTKTMSREDKIRAFDPNGLATGEGIFGLPFEVEDAQLVIIPAPWEVTVSYRGGTAQAPQAILAASKQVDLFDSEIPNAWQLGVSMLPEDKILAQQSADLRAKAAHILEGLAEGKSEDEFEKEYEIVNKGGENLRKYIKKQAKELLNEGKMVALLGGDHSTPLGLIDALASKYEKFAVLQIDAHCDLREAYEGFTYSHASIMYNVMETVPNVCKLVQVGVRDYCEEEDEYIKKSLNEKGKHKIRLFEYRTMQKDRFRGKSWDEITDEIISGLPQHIYISFDIDGLDPALCPNTGTPVPGGLQFEEAMYLIEKLVENEKIIIGFDLNEVAPGKDNEWDAAVGARVLYRLCSFAGKSQGLI